MTLWNSSVYKGSVFQEIYMLIQLSCINSHLGPDLIPIEVEMDSIYLNFSMQFHGFPLSSSVVSHYCVWVELPHSTHDTTVSVASEVIRAYGTHRLYTKRMLSDSYLCNFGTWRAFLKKKSICYIIRKCSKLCLWSHYLTFHIWGTE